MLQYMINLKEINKCRNKCVKYIYINDNKCENKMR